MKISCFRFVTLLACLALMLPGSGVVAQDQAPLRLNRDYQRVAPPQPPAIADKIEVIEFFYFGCPVCYEFEPMLNRWSIEAPKNVVLRRVPSLANPSWEHFARLYYTLEVFGADAKMIWPVFEAIHFDEVTLNRDADMVKWLSGRGFNGEKFLEVFRSQAVNAKLAEAREMLRRFDIKVVPTMLIDRKFLTTARMLGGTRQLMPTVEKLIELAQKERAN